MPYSKKKISVQDPITVSAVVRMKNISNCVAKYWRPLINVANTEEIEAAQNMTLDDAIEAAGNKVIDISYAALALLAVWDAEYSYILQLIDNNKLLKTRRLAFSGASSYKAETLTITEKHALNKIITYFERRNASNDETARINKIFSSVDDVGAQRDEDEFTDSDEEAEYQYTIQNITTCSRREYTNKKLGIVSSRRNSISSLSGKDSSEAALESSSYQIIPMNITETISKSKADIDWLEAIDIAKRNKFPFHVPKSLIEKSVNELAYHHDVFQKERVLKHKLESIETKAVNLSSSKPNLFIDKIDFSNLTLYERLQTDSMGSLEGGIVVAALDGESDIIPQTSFTSTEQYLNDVNIRQEDMKITENTMQLSSTDTAVLDSRPPSSPTLLEYVRSDPGTFFGTSTRLRTGPFTLPALASNKLADTSITDFNFYGGSLDDNSVTSARDEINMKSFSAPTLGVTQSLSDLKVPKTSSSHLAPSFTEKNSYGFDSYYKSVPNTATCFGVRPDHRTPIDDRLPTNTIRYPSSAWKPPTPARHEPCIVDILRPVYARETPSSILVKSKVALPSNGMV